MSFRKFSQGCGGCRRRKIKVLHRVNGILLYSNKTLYHDSVTCRNPSAPVVLNQGELAPDTEIKTPYSSAMKLKQ